MLDDTFHPLNIGFWVLKKNIDDDEKMDTFLLKNDRDEEKIEIFHSNVHAFRSTLSVDYLLHILRDFCTNFNAASRCLSQLSCQK